MIYIIWIVGAMIIGYIGDSRQIGGWGAFFLSLFLSPLIGLIAILISPPKGQVNKTIMSPPPIVNVADELSKFKKLLDDGVITKEEFETQKKKLL